MKGKILGKIVYAIVGVTGVASLVWFLMNLDKASEMGFWGTTAFIILTIGGINWGIKALTTKDLFEWLAKVW